MSTCESCNTQEHPVAGGHPSSCESCAEEHQIAGERRGAGVSQLAHQRNICRITVKSDVQKEPVPEQLPVT